MDFPCSYDSSVRAEMTTNVVYSGMLPRELTGLTEDQVCKRINVVLISNS